MDKSNQALIGMAVLTILALAAFAANQWRQRERVRRVTAWIGNYLAVRHGVPIRALSVNCSNDAHWPVLVSFDHPQTGSRHSAQFTCAGHPSTFAFLSEKEDSR